MIFSFQIIDTMHIIVKLNLICTHSTIVSTLSNQNFFESQRTKASKHLSTSLYILHLISYRDRVKEFLTPHLFLIYINVSINSALSSSPLWNQTDDLLER